MALDLPSLALLLFVVTHGVAFGAGVYEQRVVVPRWMGIGPDGSPLFDANAMRADDTGRRFWVFVTTFPLSLLLAVNAYYALATPPPHRVALQVACAVTLFERVLTLFYFIPTAVRLMHVSSSPAPDDTRIAHRWRALNVFRLALSLVAWLLAMYCLASIGRGGI